MIRPRILLIPVSDAVVIEGLHGGLDAFLFASGAEVPFVGLPAGAVAGLLLIPLTVVSAGVGVALGSLKD